MIVAELCRFNASLLDKFIRKNSLECFRIELQRRLPWLAINEKNEKCTDTASMVTTMESGTRVALAA